jgi:hypothetical protein
MLATPDKSIQVVEREEIKKLRQSKKPLMLDESRLGGGDALRLPLLDVIAFVLRHEGEDLQDRIGDIGQQSWKISLASGSELC